MALWAYGPQGLVKVTQEHGVHAGPACGRARPWSCAGRWRRPALTVTVRTENRPGEEITVASLAEHPSLPAPNPDLFTAGEREIRTALLLPSWHQPGSGKLPVLIDPYGGPHMQRVVAAQSAFADSQWFAEQGFAVVVADGRGTPGRGPGWDRAVAGDLAGPVLEDQVAALEAAAARCADLDTGRVAIRGWSFGGYLAALAVLRRPEKFHAAVAGAPVTDWRLYDTHYTERYLGHPVRTRPPMSAARCCGDAAELRRPLLIIHGLADDNVVAAHTLRLSGGAAGGRPAALRAAAVRRHPHDAPGRGRREPAALPGGLPAQSTGCSKGHSSRNANHEPRGGRNRVHPHPCGGITRRRLHSMTQAHAGASQGQGADRGTDPAQGPMVAAARHQRDRPRRGGDLSHLGLAGERGLLLAAVHLPAVLPLPGDHLHGGAPGTPGSRG